MVSFPFSNVSSIDWACQTVICFEGPGSANPHVKIRFRARTGLQCGPRYASTAGACEKVSSYRPLLSVLNDLNSFATAKRKTLQLSASLQHGAFVVHLFRLSLTWANCKHLGWRIQLQMSPVVPLIFNTARAGGARGLERCPLKHHNLAAASGAWGTAVGQCFDQPIVPTLDPCASKTETRHKSNQRSFCCAWLLFFVLVLVVHCALRTF